MKPYESLLIERGFLLNWLPDETVFSLCCRHVRFNNCSLTSTRNILPGLRISPDLHDYPYGLERFAELNDRRWGTASVIIDCHSIVPFLAPFQPAERVISVVDSMRGNEGSILRYYIEELIGACSARAPLKFCEECLVDDLKSYGTGYWHVIHQHPILVLCPVHKITLRESYLDVSHKERVEWPLPSDCCTRSDAARFDTSTRSIMESIADGISVLAKVRPFRSFNLGIVGELYSKALNIKRGGTDGRLAEQLRRYCRGLEVQGAFKLAPGTVSNAAAMIYRLTTCPYVDCSTASHLVMITWLYGSMENFLVDYDKLERER